MLNKFCLHFLLFLSLSLLATSCFAASGFAESPHTTILIYHKFGENRYPTTNVSLERFAKQLQYLKENNYQVIPLADLIERINSQKALPEKSVVITIDDGYRSTYTGAWPLLQSYGYPFTVFLYVKAVERKYKNFLTWDEIAEMQKGGVDFQDHGYSHFRFGDRPQGMNDGEYRTWLQEDLQRGNAILTDHLGYKPLHLALPYGEYNYIIQEEAGKLGYQAVFSQDPGSVSGTIDRFAIPREPILGNDWATMPHFKMVLERRDLPFSEMLPLVAPLAAEIPEQFCATLFDPTLYFKDSLKIYVSELGWQPGILQGNRLCIANSRPLKRRSNRVAIAAREKKSGKKVIRYWLLIKEGSHE